MENKIPKQALSTKNTEGKGIFRIILQCCIVVLGLFPVTARGIVKADTATLSSTSQIVEGRVLDQNGAPLPGVTIRLDGTNIGVVSGENGAFSLKLPIESGTLIFSFIGFKTQQVPFTASQFLTIRMQEEVSQLDEVTVVAYGTQSKRDIVGAMSTVKGEDIKDIPTPSLSNLLQGRVAGMNVVNTTGSPGGGGTSVVIRGFNSLSIESSRRGSDPLWVIDGVPMYSFTSPVTGLNTLAEIDPADIESVQVLKDAASASIYGSRAANGVILVTTKKGKRNEQAQVSANVSHTWVFRPSLPDLTGGNRERHHRMEALRNYQQALYDPETNDYRYIQSYLDAYLNQMHYDYFWNQGNGADIPVYQDSLNNFYNNSTNLFDYYFRTAKVTDANLQLRGGSEKISYNIGLGYYTETGVLKHTGFNRVKLLSNLSIYPFPKLEINLRNYISRTGRKRASRNIYGFPEGTDIEQIPEELLTTSTLFPGPGHPAFDLLTQQFERTKEKSESYRFRNSFDLSYEIIKGLKIKSSLAMDYSLQFQNLFQSSDLDEYGDSYSSNQNVRNMMLLNENLLTYKHTFNETHNLDVLLGLSFQSDEMNMGQMYGRRSPSDLIYYITWDGNVLDETTKRILKDCFSDRQKSTMVGLFGRINYNYKQKYLASITLRRDASSKFGEKVRWATFPSYAIGYVLSDESFMEWSKPYLDYAKFRLSFGKSGRQFDDPYVAYGLITPGNSFLGHPTVEPQWYDGLINRTLTWEETKQWDFGIDMDFFNHRIGLVFDYYYRYTDKLLYLVELPGNYSGYMKQWQNAYSISNEGIEFQIKADIIRKNDWYWNVTFNIAKNWNRLEKSTNNRDFWSGTGSTNINVIGKPLNGIYVFQDKGYYNSLDEIPYYYENGKKKYLGTSSQFYRPGDRVIVDVDGNGRIYTNRPLYDDQVYAGSPLPTIQGGIVSSLTWKGFDLNILFNYVFGRHILNAGKGASVGTKFGLTIDDITKPIFADLSDISFWQKPGDHTDFPANRLDDGLYNFATNLSSNVEKVNYLKLKTLTLGYTLPENIKKMLGIGVRVFVSAENLFTITNYSGPDPESVDLVTGVDNFGNYPLAKRVTLGLTLNF